MTPEKGNFRVRHRRLRRLVEALKIFDSKYQNRTIGENCQSRYAPLHLPSHVARVMNSAPQVRQRFPSRSLKPFPHTPMASSRLPRGRNREGRSFPAIGLHLLGSSGWREHSPRREQVRFQSHESNLPRTGL